MIKLSDLMVQLAEKPPVAVDDAVALGVIVDIEDEMPPALLQEIGIHAEFENGELTERVIDYAVACVLAKISVIIEVPADAEIGSLKFFMATMASASVHVSFLPPSNMDDAEAVARYVERLVEVTGLYANLRSMTRFVFPVSNYMEYLFRAVALGQDDVSFTPEDVYVIENFHSKMTTEQSDALKLAVKNEIFRVAGGESEFREYAIGLLNQVMQASEVVVADNAKMIGKEHFISGAFWLQSKADRSVTMAFYDGVDAWQILQADGRVESRRTSNAGVDYMLLCPVAGGQAKLSMSEAEFVSMLDAEGNVASEPV